MIDGRDILESWARCQIQEVASANKTCNPGQQGSGTFRYVDIEAIDNIHHKVGCPREINNAEAPSRARMHLRAGDVLFCLVRPYLKNIAIIPPDLDNSIGSTAFCVLHPDAGVDNLYLYYQLLQENLINSIPTYGTSPPSARDLEFLAQPVAIAPLNEQRRIVAKIEELFSELDAGVAALERVRAGVKRYRAAVLKAAVEGKLTEDWRAQHPDIEPASALLDRILAERRRKWEEAQLAKFAEAGRQRPRGWQSKYQEPVSVDVDQLPSVPDSWVWVALDAIASISGGITKDQNRDRTLTMREIPYLRVANVQRGYLDLGEIKHIFADEDDIEALRLKQGDILFTEGGDRDKLGRGWVWNDEISECIHQNHIFRARLLLSSLQPKFLSHHGNTFGQEWFTKTGKQTTNLASINKGILTRFPVPLVPLQEQEQIAVEVERRLSILEKIEIQVEANLRRAARLRQGILKRAFEGRLVPQDPTDEPAEQLLARIRRQRAAEAKPKQTHKRKRSKGNGATPLLPEDD